MSAPEKYKNLGLTHNPFPLQAVEWKVIDPKKDLYDDATKFCVQVREKEVQWITKKIIEPLKAGKQEKCPNVWITAKRGVGKSALLKYIAFTLQGSSVIPLYVKRPVKGLPDIFSDSIRFLGSDFMTELALSAYMKFLKDLTPENAQFFNRKKFNEIKLFLTEDISRLTIFAKSPAEARKILKQKKLTINDVNVKGMCKAVSNWMVTKCGVLLPTFAIIFASFPFSPDEQFSKLLKVKKKDMIDCLVSIMLLAEKVMGCTAILLIFDELDQVWEGLSGPQKRKIGLDVRMIAEHSRGKIKLVGVSLGKEMFEDMEKSGYIKDAIPITPETVFEVFEFDENQTKRLMAHYLSKARQPGTEGFIEPFTEKVALAINRYCGGNARKILEECRALVEYAADKDYCLIDEKVASEYKTIYKDLIMALG